MYLVVIQVPIYVDGARTLVTTEWRRSLTLLRDSFEGFRWSHASIMHNVLELIPGIERLVQVGIRTIIHRHPGLPAQFDAKQIIAAGLHTDEALGRLRYGADGLRSAGLHPGFGEKRRPAGGRLSTGHRQRGAFRRLARGGLAGRWRRGKTVIRQVRSRCIAARVEIPQGGGDAYKCYT